MDSSLRLETCSESSPVRLLRTISLESFGLKTARINGYVRECSLEMITSLSDIEARELLEYARVARLGCIANGEPYITPINYKIEGDYVYSHSLAGLKITALRLNSRACLQVDEVDSDLRWRSVLAFGDFEEILRPGERAEILSKLLKRYPMLTPVESAIAEDGYSPEVIVFRIRIDRITGLAEG